ncbi:uncharacterized protein LOC128191978 [Crassostrea angulata]|uniref:uncharacterized protein LOC128191978 n=1 Tax=Magallana angulata TaxID=2784310 RepID=UPI0022B10C61|nr:uncharacterized protein LOC128191978 [Crassostrea angulata]
MGNRLLISLISNDDRLTSKGFQLTLKASLLISEDIELSPSYVIHIKSPGYPKVNYKSNTIYTWNVTAPAETKEILIDINMDIIRPSRGLCEDYLKIEEIDPFGGSFTIFNECGKLTMKRSALGNRLLIKLVSNYDELTSKGFELNLREMRSSIRMRTTTAATNNISTSNWSLPVPIARQKKQYFTTQEQLTHSTYSALAITMETTSKDITSASLGSSYCT